VELPTPPNGGSWVVLLMRCLLIGGRLSVVQPRTDDKEAPMNRHVEELGQRTAAYSERFDTVIIGGVARDAEHIAQHLASRQRNGRSPVHASERKHR
jgi:hypothetical protein